MGNFWWNYWAEFKTLIDDLDTDYWFYCDIKLTNEGSLCLRQSLMEVMYSTAYLYIRTTCKALLSLENRTCDAGHPVLYDVSCRLWYLIYDSSFLGGS